MFNLRQQRQVLLVGLLGAAISLARQYIADSKMFDSIWAEDGWMPLCVVANGHGSCLGRQVNGYWPVVHRLLAEPFALLPLNSWPYVFPVLGALLTGALCALAFGLFRSFGSAPAGLMVGIGLALLPSLGIEFINVVGNVHWILLLATMVLLTKFDSGKADIKYVGALVFAASLANPAGFVLSVQAALLGLAGVIRARQWMSLVIASLLGWTIQVCAIFFFGGAERIGTTSTIEQKLENWANSLLGVVPGIRVAEHAQQGFLHPANWLTPSAIVISVLFGLVAVLINPRRSLVQRKFAALGLSTQALAVFLLLILDENPRYTFVVVALNLLRIVGLVRELGRTRVLLPALGLALIVLPLPALKVGSYRATHSDVSWHEQLRNAQETCSDGTEQVELVFAPGETYPTTVNCAALGYDD